VSLQDPLLAPPSLTMRFRLVFDEGVAHMIEEPLPWAHLFSFAVWMGHRELVQEARQSLQNLMSVKERLESQRCH
jgi:hypothetical protein